MKTKELKILIEAAEALGHNDIDLVLIDGRYGEESYPEAVAKIVKINNQTEGDYIAIGVTYE